MPAIPSEAALILGILIAVLLALITVGGIATAYTYARRAVRKARILQRAEGGGGAKHPNQSVDGAEPTPPTLELAGSVLSLLRSNTPSGASDTPEKPPA